MAGTLLSSPQAQSLPLTSISGLQNTFVSSFHTALLVCAAFAALGIFTALARGNEAAVKKVSRMTPSQHPANVLRGQIPTAATRYSPLPSQRGASARSASPN